MNDRFDTVIIGAGIIGTAIAFELSKCGRKTLNVDMLPAAGYGSTSSSCAIIRFHYSTLEACAIAYDGYFYWKNWAQYLELPETEDLASYIETGCLIMKTEHNGYLRKSAGIMDALGVPYEDWDSDRIRERFPAFDMRCFAPPKLLHDPDFGEPTGGEIGGGMFFPNGGYVSDPQLATRNIQVAAQAKGAEFLFNKRVVEIPVAGNKVRGVVLDDGSRIDAPVVINVAGPHSSQINALARADKDMRITTKALRQEVAHVPTPPELDYANTGMVLSDSDAAVYSRPELGDNILIGSEDPECDKYEVVDPDDFDENFTDQWTTQVMREAQRIPSLKIPSRTAGVVALYDCTEDWMPIYDKSCIEGFYLACGSSGNQFKNAQVAGKMMAKLIEYTEAGNDHDTTPMHYTLEHLDRSVNVGMFSRLREINRESTFSVLG